MKNITKQLLAVCMIFANFAARAQNHDDFIYKNPKAPVEERVKDLLGRMTLKEKIAQMRHIHENDYDINKKVDLEKLKQSTGGLSYGCVEAFPYSSKEYAKAIYDIQKHMRENTRLGIPVIPIMEGMHGTVQDGCTIYPQSIAIAATFNPDFTYRMAKHIAQETKAMGVKQILSPGLDLARELRWGRVEETYGEDPFLVSQMGIGYVKALTEANIIPTPKHFIAHGTPTGGLNLASVEGGKRQLYSLYLQPFEKIIKETAPLSIMNCYSSYDGEAVTGSVAIMTDLLRKQLGFKGYVYSDWGSITMLNSFHRTAISIADAARQAVEAGIDLEAGSKNYTHLEELIKQNKIDLKYIDAAVSNILYAKFASGLFEDPLPDTAALKKYIHTSQSVKLAREIAEESIVLLKNDGLLPLDINKIKSLAVVGPNADQVQFGDYTWSRNNKDGVTPLQGLRNLLGNKVRINYAKGCDITSKDVSGFKEALNASRNSDVTIVFVGSQSASLSREYENSTSGEGFDLSSLNLTGVQEELIKSLKETGKPVIVVLVTGRPFAMSWVKENIPAILVQWYGGEQQGNAIADVLFGKVNPSGKLPVSFPKSTGNLPVFYNYFPSDKGYYKKGGSEEKPGRDYVFETPGALWSFGYGGSYTKFQFDNVRFSKDKLKDSDTLFVQLDITNTGNQAGKEVVQGYLKDVFSSVVTPVKQLKAFQKVNLKAGERKTVTLSFPVDDWYLYDKNYERKVEDGEFEIQLGSASDAIFYKKTVRVGEEDGGLNQTVSSVEQLPKGEMIQITGTVRDVQSTRLSGVKVSVKGEDLYTLTDEKGNYEIKARINDVLVFSYKGYAGREVRVYDKKPISIRLEQ